MKCKAIFLASMLAAQAAVPARADSLEQASAASFAASALTAASVGWVAHEGSQFTVNALDASGETVVLSLHGVGNSLETTARISQQAAQAASVGVGTSVSVLAESIGYALMASGTLLAFIPNEAGWALIYHARHAPRQ
jgi:hypothetical protein